MCVRNLSCIFCILVHFQSSSEAFLQGSDAGGPSLSSSPFGTLFCLLPDPVGAKIIPLSKTLPSSYIPATQSI